jgi:hypothetical protein
MLLTHLPPPLITSTRPPTPSLSPPPHSTTAPPPKVYFHKTSDDPEDYLVDHSIITYLIDPNGEFVTFYGKNFDAPTLAASIGQHASGGGGGGGGGGGAPAGQAGSQEGRAQR